MGAWRLRFQFLRSPHQGFRASLVFECYRVRGTTWILLLLMARKRCCYASVCHRDKWCRFFSSMVASQTGAKMRVYYLLRLILLLHNLVGAKSQVRSFYSKCLVYHQYCVKAASCLWCWIIALRFRLHQICMDCYLCLWYVLSLTCFRFISISFMNRMDTLWYQAWLHSRAQLLFTLLWCLSVGYWPSMWCSPLDELMDMASWECLWILTIFLSSLLAKLFTWLSTVMVHISDLAFLSGFDEDHFGFTHGKHLRANPFISLAGYSRKVLKGKEKGMRKYEVFETSLDLLIENRISLMDLCLLCLYHFGIP